MLYAKFGWELAKNLPLKRAWPVIWVTLSTFHQSMHCAKFGLNWPGGSGDEDENVKSLQTANNGQ